MECITLRDRPYGHSKNVSRWYILLHFPFSRFYIPVNIMYKVFLPGRMQDIVKRIEIVKHMILFENFHGLLAFQMMCQFVVFQAEDFEIQFFSIHKNTYTSGRENTPCFFSLSNKLYSKGVLYCHTFVFSFSSSL